MFASGGWCLLAMVFSYWLVDLRQKQKWVMFVVYVGMNPLFIYLFNNFGATNVVKGAISPWLVLLFGWSGEVSLQVLIRGAAWFINWYLCYWLYKRKIFIRI
jgi:hypothetical protein